MNTGEWKIGDELDPVALTYSLETFREFLRIYAGDVAEQIMSYNIHTSDEFARGVGLRGASGFATLPTGQIYRMLAKNLGKAARPTGSISVKFMRPFYSGDTLTARGQIVDVVAISESSNTRELAIDVWCEDQSGAKICAGSAVSWVDLPSGERSSE